MKTGCGLVLCLWLSGACSRGGASDAPPAAVVVTAGTGSGGSTAPAPECQADTDCVVTCRRMDNCCPQMCACTNAFSRAAATALEARQETECRGVPCPVASCAVPTETTVAHCQSGRCVPQTVPLRPTP